MEKSTHKAEVVPVILEKHPNADSLSIIKVFNYNVIGKTSDWENVEKAVYLPPDSLVPLNNPLFEWLKSTTSTYYDENSNKTPVGNYARITVRRFRKILSYGLLVPCNVEKAVIGDNVAEELGVLHYDPPEMIETRGGEVASGPNVYSLKYDVDSFQRYAFVFTPGEEVIATEKIHGANGRGVFHNGNFHCGSRTEWKKENEGNLWWRALRNYPEIQEWLKSNPDHLLYGEVYGQVQNLKYGSKSGEVKIALFDIMRNGLWIDHDVAREMGKGLPWVPEVGRMAFDFDKLMALAEGPSLVVGADHFREGIVVKPVKERNSAEIGRVQLKIVSASYLEKC